MLVSPTYNPTVRSVVSMSAEVQDQLMRLPKLMPAVGYCEESFNEMVLALRQMRAAFMAFETKARGALDLVTEDDDGPL